MIPIPHDFLAFLKCLSEYRVKYLLIGGYAVAYHGYVRTTGDFLQMLRNPGDAPTQTKGG